MRTHMLLPGQRTTDGGVAWQQVCSTTAKALLCGPRGQAVLHKPGCDGRQALQHVWQRHDGIFCQVQELCCSLSM